jgi:hypothetical protein
MPFVFMLAESAFIAPEHAEHVGDQTSQAHLSTLATKIVDHRDYHEEA